MWLGIRFLVRVYLVSMVAGLCSCRPELALNRVRRQAVSATSPVTGATETSTVMSTSPMMAPSSTTSAEDGGTMVTTTTTEGSGMSTSESTTPRIQTSSTMKPETEKSSVMTTATTMGQSSTTSADDSGAAMMSTEGSGMSTSESTTPSTQTSSTEVATTTVVPTASPETEPMTPTTESSPAESTSMSTDQSTIPTAATMSNTTTAERAEPNVIYRFAVRNFALNEEDMAGEGAQSQEQVVDNAENGPCPADFVQVNNGSCYRALSRRVSWSQAEKQCRRAHADSFPVAINGAEEQMAVHAVSALLDYKKCPMFWTCGQRANVQRAGAPMVWKLRPFVWQTMYDFENWSPAKKTRQSGDCLCAMSAGQKNATVSGAMAGVWATGPCEALHCVICELPIITID